MQDRAEHDLIAEGQLGNHAAISELFRRYQPFCLRLAGGILRSDEESQDAVQSALLNAFQHLNSFRGDAAFKTWLGRIVVNQCFMRLRVPERRQHWVELDTITDNGMSNLLPSAAPSPEMLTWCKEVREAVADGVTRLPEPLREVFTLYAGSGLTLREVAGTLGLSLPAAKTRLFRANLRLRSHLAPIWSAMSTTKTGVAAVAN